MRKKTMKDPLRELARAIVATQAVLRPNEPFKCVRGTYFAFPSKDEMYMALSRLKQEMLVCGLGEPKVRAEHSPYQLVVEVGGIEIMLMTPEPKKRKPKLDLTKIKDW